MTDNSPNSYNNLERVTQPDSSTENQVDLHLHAHRHNDHSNTNYVPIQNAHNVNISPPAIPANDMVLLEQYHPGAIDRILKMSEIEQTFTHQLVKSEQLEQVKINQRNVEISKEQNRFNTIKLWMGFFIIIGLIVIAFYLFTENFIIGGSCILFAALVLAAVFVLGYFPEKIFDIFRRNNSSE